MEVETSAEDREIEALLNLNLEGLESLGTVDLAFAGSGFKSAPGPKPVAPPPAPKPFPVVSAEPFARSLGRMADRNMVYKATLIKDHQTAVHQIREAYEAILMGDFESLLPVRTVAANLMEAFRRDPPGILALSLTRASSPDDYPFRHAVNVCLLTLASATAAGAGKPGVLEAGTAALLADVGMHLVPEEILNKSGKLTEAEMAEIHRHPGYSVSLLSGVKAITPVILQVAQQHHERLTGSGYPEHRSGSQIIPEARMVGIADTLTAMVHKRSHREAMSPQEALERVVKMGQMNFLDFEILKGLVGYLSVYPLGSVVELANGRIGRVVEAHPEEPARPIVAVVRDASGPLPLKSIYRLDLKTAREEKILKCVDAEALGFKPLDGF